MGSERKSLHSETSQWFRNCNSRSSSFIFECVIVEICVGGLFIWRWRSRPGARVQQMGVIYVVLKNMWLWLCRRLNVCQRPKTWAHGASCYSQKKEHPIRQCLSGNCRRTWYQLEPLLHACALGTDESGTIPRNYPFKCNFIEEKMLPCERKTLIKWLTFFLVKWLLCVCTQDIVKWMIMRN